MGDEKSNNKSDILNIHIFTDSTGETTLNICNVTMSQFPNVQYKLFCWPFIKTINDASDSLDAVKKHPGVIVYTILPQNVISYIKDQIKNDKNITIVPALEKVIQAFTNHTGIKVEHLKSRESVIDPEYNKKMEAIQYAMNHDDGKIVNDLESADIIILGVSRASKTPTSLYLAYRGFKVINIPYFIGSIMPKEIYSVKKPIIIGLLIDSLRLLHLRKHRELGGVRDSIGDKYTDLQIIEEEMESCRYLFGRLSCPVVDVTNKSVEEVSAHIIKIYNFLRD
ncbi:MAG: pyruvate, phosphate dikinase/phosphoenolpyruvate synthase regulator [Alphaproteobacteria bacterium]|nr:pyruvate, phosphate dikinase/phosphoenolpyruvate synthase regulator [Rickettsiales bacterium]